MLLRIQYLCNEAPCFHLSVFTTRSRSILLCFAVASQSCTSSILGCTFWGLLMRSVKSLLTSFFLINGTALSAQIADLSSCMAYGTKVIAEDEEYVEVEVYSDNNCDTDVFIALSVCTEYPSIREQSGNVRTSYHKVRVSNTYSNTGSYYFDILAGESWHVIANVGTTPYPDFLSCDNGEQSRYEVIKESNTDSASSEFTGSWSGYAQFNGGLSPVTFEIVDIGGGFFRLLERGYGATALSLAGNVLTSETGLRLWRQEGEWPLVGRRMVPVESGQPNEMIFFLSRN